MKAREWQFDGLVGPTHNYAGLALGNIAATKNAGLISNPRAAALQGLDKMAFVRGLGMPQAFLPPHFRPALRVLNSLGFKGSVGAVLDHAARVAPGLLASVFSSSFMWAANAATVTPSADSMDGRLHLTPANLMSHMHRSIESAFTQDVLSIIFRNEALFKINNPLHSVSDFSDEGAANHMRICNKHENKGFELFVFGKSHEIISNSNKFASRQSKLASEAIIRLNYLNTDSSFVFRQSPIAIDHGVFHHDVIGMNTTSKMIIHEQSFIMEDQIRLRSLAEEIDYLRLYEVHSTELSLFDAVGTYFFNSQYLELPDGTFALVAPSECANHAGVALLVERLMGEKFIDQVHYLDVRESMRNGGGPACLRLRIVMTPEQESAIHSGVVLTEARERKLRDWVNTHYRDRLHFDNFRDPQFVKELDYAYDALTAIIGMPGLYDSVR